MQIISILGALLALAAALFYIFSIVKGETKPSRSTWWIITLVMLLTILSSYSLDALENISIQLVYLFAYLTVAIFSLSKKYGYGTQLLLIDKICLFGAIVCGLLWLLFNSALIAFLGSIILDCIGLLPTIIKAWKDPQTESTFAWIIGTIGILFNAIGITHWFSTGDLSWVYALYLMITNLFITALVIINKREKRLLNMIK